MNEYTIFLIWVVTKGILSTVFRHLIKLIYIQCHVTVQFHKRDILVSLLCYLFVNSVTYLLICSLYFNFIHIYIYLFPQRYFHWKNEERKILKNHISKTSTIYSSLTNIFWNRYYMFTLFSKSSIWCVHNEEFVTLT